MGRRVAGSRREARERDDSILDDAMVVIALVPTEQGLEVRYENRGGVPEEDVAAAIREAASQLRYGHDRAKGMW